MREEESESQDILLNNINGAVLNRAQEALNHNSSAFSFAYTNVKKVFVPTVVIIGATERKKDMKKQKIPNFSRCPAIT